MSARQWIGPRRWPWRWMTGEWPPETASRSTAISSPPLAATPSASRPATVTELTRPAGPSPAVPVTAEPRMRRVPVASATLVATAEAVVRESMTAGTAMPAAWRSATSA